MEIIPMNAAHVPNVAALEKACFRDPWSEASISGELDNPLSLWLVAVEQGAVVGYIGSQTVLDEADVMNVAVDPAMRRRGVGKALLRELETRLRTESVCALSLEVRPSNRAAVGLYTKLGFAEEGRRRNFYNDPTEDALILTRRFPKEGEA